MGTRNPRQCRERWNNYVNPDLRKDPWTPEEDKILEEKYAEIGPKWNKLARFLSNRSDNSIRNRWMMISRHRSITSNPKKQIKSQPSKPSNDVDLGQIVFPGVDDFDSFNEPLFINHGIDFSLNEKGIDIWENFSFF
ncbi:Myb-like DNA-binding domain containing protein [Histomonas meleagridis]|uniref:Myb-like DNA-binding domain containing protein n=1 Tax=Histomonas meleagridis TaxID=135588 RepID=UPI00355A3CE0|nr:Myb-like DNA-binding domain containing protein [Histomonas meleagridis]KAH0806191.1 Myb-like DNA-binding domain containing protein [Histomonas meleagridis]